MGPNPAGLVSYKKRRSGHRHTERDDPVRTQGEDGRLHAVERKEITLLTP